MNFNAIKAHPAAQASIVTGDYHQAILDIGYDAWQQPANKEWSYAEMLEYVETNFGEVAKLLVQLGKYNQQVENGGHHQYYDNGYAGTEDRHRRNDEVDISLHQELVHLFNKHRFQYLPNGEKVQNILTSFRVYKDEEKHTTEACCECSGHGCDDCDNGEVEVDNPDYGSLANTEELDQLDAAYYAVHTEFMEALNGYAKDWLTKGTNPIPDGVPFDPFDLESSAKTTALTLPTVKPRVKLVGADGNAFNVMGMAQRAMRQAKVPTETVDAYLKEAMAGDYDHLLAVTMKYCDVY